MPDQAQPAPQIDARNRWQRAQQAELVFWRTWRARPTWRDFDMGTYWARQHSRFHLDRECVNALSVVEVGCGPFGSIFYLPSAGRRIALDPLAGQFPEAASNASVLTLRAVGEALPLSDAIADVVICYNVLDHVQDPVRVLRELRRIARVGAQLCVMLHTFPRLLCPFLGFDLPHPHHWSAPQAIRLIALHGFQVCEVMRETAGFNASWCQPRTWKYAAGNVIAKALHVTARAI